MISSPPRKPLLARAILGGCLLLAACSPSRATQANYDKIEPLMTRDQIYALLGKPDSVNTTGNDAIPVKVETWDNGLNTITVTFSGGQMVMKNIKSEGHNPD